MEIIQDQSGGRAFLLGPASDNDEIKGFYSHLDTRVVNFLKGLGRVSQWLRSVSFEGW